MIRKALKSDHNATQLPQRLLEMLISGDSRKSKDITAMQIIRVSLEYTVDTLPGTFFYDVADIRHVRLSLIHISEPTRPVGISRMPSSA